MNFQFLRPEWMLMFIPVLFIAGMYWRKQLHSKDWASVVDARLLPHLLTEERGRSSRVPLFFWVMLAFISIVALAGPVWKKLPLPVFKQQSALVIALDLSRSMNATDVNPSRLARARLKMTDLLKLRSEGQTALIAYAATPYTVSPLTDDTDTIQSLVSSLTTDIMPAQGSRTDLAVEKALELFSNAGINQGDILLITDGINQGSRSAIHELDTQGFRISILSVGTEEGAPIPVQGGGFLKDAKGSIVIPRTTHAELRSVSSSLGGMYSAMSIDDKDIESFSGMMNRFQALSDHEKTDFKADRWKEEGPWLLLTVVPLAALAFRRGLFLSLFLVMLVLPMPEDAMADGWQWQDLFKNQNQRAQQLLESGDAKNAAQLFKQQDWKAAAHYKAGEYEQALKQLEHSGTPESSYNRGNSLARMGQLEEAMEAYDEMLEKNPQHEDAKFNRDLVEKALKEQQKQQQDQQSDQQNQNQQDQDKQNSQDQQSQDDSQNSQQESEQSSSESESQDKEQQQKDQQAREQEKQQSADEEQQKQQAEKSEAEPMDESEKLSKQAEAQWLRRIPDDPGGLLRNKFKYQYGRQQQSSQEEEQW